MNSAADGDGRGGDGWRGQAGRHTSRIAASFRGETGGFEAIGPARIGGGPRWLVFYRPTRARQRAWEVARWAGVAMAGGSVLFPDDVATVTGGLVPATLVGVVGVVWALMLWLLSVRTTHAVSVGAGELQGLRITRGAGERYRVALGTRRRGGRGRAVWTADPTPFLDAAAAATAAEAESAGDRVSRGVGGPGGEPAEPGTCDERGARSMVRETREGRWEGW